MPDIYPAQLAGIDLLIETIEDRVEKALVKHEYPYKNGALVEDMGESARTVKIRCYFWDATYGGHIELLRALKDMESVEMIHPQHGPLQGSIESVSVRYDDREQTAEIDISFVESLITDSGDQTQPDLTGAVEEAFLAGVASRIQGYIDEIYDIVGSAAGIIVNQVINPAQNLYGQFSGLGSAALAYIGQVDNFLALLRGTQSGTENPRTSLIAAASYPDTVPGAMIGAIDRCVERQGLANASVPAPTRQMVIAEDIGTLASAVGTFSKQVILGGASGLALQTAYSYRDDDDLARELHQRATVPAFDVLGRYRGNDNTQRPMTAPELELSLGTSRTLIQQALDLDRYHGDHLKTMAARLMEYAHGVLLDRERIIHVWVDPAIPLHLVCLRHGLPYSDADRILRISAVRNPNEVFGEVAIYAD